MKILSQPFLILILLISLFSEKSLKAEIFTSNKLNTRILEKKEQALEFMVGTFHQGPYAPYEMKKNKWTTCTAMNLCIDNKLYGDLIGLRYIKNFRKLNLKNIYFDYIGIYAKNSPIINDNKIHKYSGGKDKYFFMFSVIPTYRKYFSGLNAIYIGEMLEGATDPRREGIVLGN